VATDLGLFGPDSVTWRVHADPTMGVAGLRALLLQALHPLAMAGVHQHSAFRDQPWGRLFRTAEYVGVITYGTTAEARKAAARVRGLHRNRTGVEPESGQAYRVNDPELLLWVHASEIDSFLSCARRGGLSLSAAEADRYVAEQVRAARLVGIEGAVPASVAELNRYFELVRPQLRVTEAARSAVRFVLVPPMPLWVGVLTPARPAWVGMASLALTLLPRWARRLYGLPGLPTTDLGASLTARGLRTALLAVPPVLRDGPHLRAAQARAAAAPVRRLEALPVQHR